MKQCKKIGYKTKREAKKALKEVRKEPLYIRGKFIKKARQFYRCSHCRNFHITSKK